MLFFAVLLEYNLLNTALAKALAYALPSQEGKAKPRLRLGGRKDGRTQTKLTPFRHSGPDPESI
jgi:hypothetical protein